MMGKPKKGHWICGVLGLAALLASAGCVVRPKEANGPAADAIEAATTIQLSSERLEVLERIADRDDLSEPEQIYLVNAICFGGFGGQQADALITLIRNPLCTSATRQHITKHLRSVAFSSERKRVAEALTEQQDRNGAREP